VRDRTFVLIQVLESARQAVEDAFGRPGDECAGDLRGTVRLTFSEVLGGGLDLLTALAESGVVFRGFHDDGDEYHGVTFAAHDGIFAATLSPLGQLMVAIDPQTCEPSALGLAAARRWRQVDDQVIAFFTRHGRRC
jgi:hypothetical protein